MGLAGVLQLALEILSFEIIQFAVDRYCHYQPLGCWLQHVGQSQEHVELFLQELYWLVNRQHVY